MSSDSYNSLKSLVIREDVAKSLLKYCTEGNISKFISELKPLSKLERRNYFIKVRDEEDRSLLHISCLGDKSDHMKIIKLLLLEEQIDINNNNNDLKSRRASSVTDDRREMVFDINTLDRDGWTPLLCACSVRNCDAILLLLDREGVDVNLGNSNKNAPIHFLARSHESEIQRMDEILERFKAKSLNINAANIYGESAVHLCMWKNNLSMLKKLLNLYSGQVNINMTTIRDETPLHWAAMIGAEDAAKVLIDAGANVLIRSSKGTASDVCDKHENLKGILKEYETTAHRGMIMKEILETEEIYCESMGVLCNVYQKPLLSATSSTGNLQQIPQSSIHNIFANCDELLKLSQEMSASFRRQRVDDIVKSFSDKLRKIQDFYFTFCSNQNLALMEIKNLKTQRNLQVLNANTSDNNNNNNNNDDSISTKLTVKPHDYNPTLFINFLQEAQNKPECRKLDLEAFLIKPMQRVTRYPLLLKELLRNLNETDPLHARLESTLENLKKTLTEINQASANTKLIEIPDPIESKSPDIQHNESTAARLKLKTLRFVNKMRLSGNHSSAITTSTPELPNSPTTSRGRSLTSRRKTAEFVIGEPQGFRSSVFIPGATYAHREGHVEQLVDERDWIRKWVVLKEGIFTIYHFNKIDKELEMTLSHSLVKEYLPERYATAFFLKNSTTEIILRTTSTVKTTFWMRDLRNFMTLSIQNSDAPPSPRGKGTINYGVVNATAEVERLRRMVISVSKEDKPKALSFYKSPPLSPEIYQGLDSNKT